MIDPRSVASRSVPQLDVGETAQNVVAHCVLSPHALPPLATPPGAIAHAVPVISREGNPEHENLRKRSGACGRRSRRRARLRRAPSVAMHDVVSLVMHVGSSPKIAPSANAEQAFVRSQIACASDAQATAAVGPPDDVEPSGLFGTIAPSWSFVVPASFDVCVCGFGLGVVLSEDELEQPIAKIKPPRTLRAIRAGVIFMGFLF